MTKTHCVHGHEYTPENTAVNNRGQIFCRICSRIKAQRYKAQNPDVVKAHRKKYGPIWHEKNRPKMRAKSRVAGSTSAVHYNDGVEAERAAIVAWLRSQGGHHDDIYAEAADDIEAGAHRKDYQVQQGEN
jgi:hypothetical protein